ncbi:cation transport protein-domain-containing protein [Cristinia sonorae]|uniref:Potassium transport protein n=1 Tax=Cristinia sonorae TaxID=1940300 RepID=A0A8K0XL78_9AGAR|nr:cation transport protein-domain-containing protein [Cristinia sonorae]
MVSIRTTRSSVYSHSNSFSRYIKRHLNFFRIHILFFTFTPLIFSAIFYASNGENHISYTDALFNCVSAITVCGLATVDLSSLTNFQQAILFFLMCIGNPVIISWVMVYVRRHFFKAKFNAIVQAEMSRRVHQKVGAPVDLIVAPWYRKLWIQFKQNFSGSDSGSSHREEPSTSSRLRPEMIRRMDDAPKLVNPSGWISEGSPGDRFVPSPQKEEGPNSHQVMFSTDPSSVPSEAPSISEEVDSVIEGALTPASQRSDIFDHVQDRKRSYRLSDPGVVQEKFQGKPSPVSMQRYQTINVTVTTPERSQDALPRTFTMPRTHTVEFAPSPRGRHGPPVERGRRDRLASIVDTESFPRVPTQHDRRSMARTLSIPRTMTTHSHHVPLRTKHRGFGGFPMPHEIISSLFRRFFPKLEHQLTRTITIPRTQTIASQGGPSAPGVKLVNYISFEAVVGRNSMFHQLTHEQLEELGGVEYRGLTALLWIVGAYHIVLQVISFIVIAPYISTPRWHSAFIPPDLHRNLSPVWFSAFQVVSSYTNTGMSLEDMSMIPFQTAYPMILFMILLILAGNTAFPILLRLTIWIVSKCVSKTSRLHETLHFLLDHPRRCFVYLFPSHQTWFLLTVLVTLNFTDWFFFLVLDIGNPAIESVPFGTRFLLGFLQAAAVRAAGFGSVSIAALAPAVKVLYVIMMYVSIYPVAMSVRSTNVYEEKSLGVFHSDEDEDEESHFNPVGNRYTVWSRYLAMHMRKQLSFDMWWLGLGLFLVCIIERDALDNPESFGWFNIFTILFELVSAYGTVGLSLGVPYANYSFSGALRPLSKIIVCLVMLRGRHRGLPVAIDRAIMLPVEYEESPELTLETGGNLPMKSTLDINGNGNGVGVGEKEKTTRFEDPSPHGGRGVSFRSASVGSRAARRRTVTVADDSVADMRERPSQTQIDQVGEDV